MEQAKQYQCNNTFYKGDYNYNLSEIISEEEYKTIPPQFRKWFTEVGKPLHFYCQNLTGDVGFSIDEWNEAFEEVKNMSESIQREVLGSRPACKEQCFACMAIVGERQAKTKQLC